jgi:probable rRNA maturation factor
MNSIELNYEGNVDLNPDFDAEDFAAQVLKFLEIDDWELSLLYCDDAFIQTLNREFRKKDYPTDVLSFAAEEDLRNEKGQLVAGDIIISLQAVTRNCEEFDEEFTKEVKRLIIHGILHLAGHDHESNDENEPMLKYQEEILEKLGEKN